MKEKVEVIVLFLILILCIIGISYFLNKETEKRFGSSNTVINQDEEVVTDNVESKVIAVTNETFENEVLDSNQKVVIDFYADWCGPCKVFSPIFEKVSQELEDVKFVRVNVDEEPELANKYMAYSIPYIVVIENGEVVNSHTGLVDEEALKQLIKN